VTVTLSYLDDLTMLDVHDDGVGFDHATTVASAAGAGLGLHAMTERVATLGGSLAVESAPGEGTTIAVEVPAPAGEAQVEPTEGAPR
jgi:signal transduction histidine kinase